MQLPAAVIASPLDIKWNWELGLKISDQAKVIRHLTTSAAHTTSEFSLDLLNSSPVLEKHTRSLLATVNLAVM